VEQKFEFGGKGAARRVGLEKNRFTNTITHANITNIITHANK